MNDTLIRPILSWFPLLSRRQQGPINSLNAINNINRDYLLYPIARTSIDLMVKHGVPIISPMFEAPNEGQPRPARAFLSTPVFDRFETAAEDNNNVASPSQVMGYVGVTIPWETYFNNLLPEKLPGIDVVLDDSCGKVYTFRLDGWNVTVLGEGDLHNKKFNDMERRSTIGHEPGTDIEETNFYVFDNCVYQMRIYPTQAMEDQYTTDQPIIYAVAVGIIFVFTAFVFLIYDWAVQLRQNKVLKTATRTQAIVSSLFPKNVQERIFKDVEEGVKQEEKSKAASRFRGNRTKDQLRNFLDDGTSMPEEKHTSLKSKPIADLFPEATVIFADLVGFTAWSSTREPTQVFTLLENIYHSFDEIAKRRRIFKVETVGGT